MITINTGAEWLIHEALNHTKIASLRPKSDLQGLLGVCIVLEIEGRQRPPTKYSKSKPSVKDKTFALLAI